MHERRKHTRIRKTYHIDYGPLSALVRPQELKPGNLHDISAGGVSFSCADFFPAGMQLLIHIKVRGWRDGSSGVEKVDDVHAELLLKTIAQVVRVSPDPDGTNYLVAAKFLGRVAPDAGREHHG